MRGVKFLREDAAVLVNLITWLLRLQEACLSPWFMSGIQLIEALTVVSDGLSEISEKSFWFLQVPVSMYPKTCRYISSERLYVPEWLVFYS